MDWDGMKGNWRRATERVKSTWGSTTDDEINSLAVRRRHLIGQLQARYGVLKDDAEKQIDDLMAKLSLKTKKSKHEKVDKVS